MIYSKKICNTLPPQTSYYTWNGTHKKIYKIIFTPVNSVLHLLTMYYTSLNDEHKFYQKQNLQFFLKSL